MPTIKQVGGYFDSVYLAHWSLPSAVPNKVDNLRRRDGLEVEGEGENLTVLKPTPKPKPRQGNATLAGHGRRG